MLRTLLLIAPLFALLVAGCGGGSDNKAEANGTDGGAAASGPTATPTPKLLPTPPKAQDTEIIVSVSAGEMAFTPTLAEFRDLPRTTIDANGKKEGVSLAELATRVSAPSGTYVTLQGYRPDGRVITCAPAARGRSAPNQSSSWTILATSALFRARFPRIRGSSTSAW
jgi:hypothetical protein